jgi:hypothetical protein
MELRCLICVPEIKNKHASVEAVHKILC